MNWQGGFSKAFLFTQSIFIETLLCAGPMTNTEYIMLNKADIVPCPCGANILVWGKGC